MTDSESKLEYVGMSLDQTNKLLDEIIDGKISKNEMRAAASAAKSEVQSILFLIH